MTLRSSSEDVFQALETLSNEQHASWQATRAPVTEDQRPIGLHVHDARTGVRFCDTRHSNIKVSLEVTTRYPWLARPSILQCVPQQR
jgi:hypothetical protein